MFHDERAFPRGFNTVQNQFVDLADGSYLFERPLEITDERSGRSCRDLGAERCAIWALGLPELRQKYLRSGRDGTIRKRLASNVAMSKTTRVSYLSHRRWTSTYPISPGRSDSGCI